MKKILLVISLSISTGYADDESQSSWYSGLSDSVANIMYEIKDHGSGFVYGANYWMIAGREEGESKNAVYKEAYQSALNNNLNQKSYQSGYMEGYAYGENTNWVNRMTRAIEDYDIALAIGNHVVGLMDGKDHWYQLGLDIGLDSDKFIAKIRVESQNWDKGYEDGFNDAKKGIDATSK